MYFNFFSVPKSLSAFVFIVRYHCTHFTHWLHLTYSIAHCLALSGTSVPPCCYVPSFGSFAAAKFEQWDSVWIREKDQHEYKYKYKRFGAVAVLRWIYTHAHTMLLTGQLEITQRAPATTTKQCQVLIKWWTKVCWLKRPSKTDSHSMLCQVKPTIALNSILLHFFSVFWFHIAPFGVDWFQNSTRVLYTYTYCTLSTPSTSTFCVR